MTKLQLLLEEIKAHVAEVNDRINKDIAVRDVLNLYRIKVDTLVDKELSEEGEVKP